MPIVKILLVVAIVWIVWRGFNRISTLGQGSRNRPRSAERPGRREAAQRATQRPIEDMVKCPKCGAYVATQGNHRCEG